MSLCYWAGFGTACLMFAFLTIWGMCATAAEADERAEEMARRVRGGGE